GSDYDVRPGRGGVLVGQRGWMPVKKRVRLEREMVEGQMRRARLERRVDIGARLGQRLLGERDHEIEVDVVERVPGDFDRAPSFAVVVNAAERFEVLGIEGLNADREPIHAGFE